MPIDPADPALRSEAWRGPLALFRARRYDAALQAFRKTSARLDGEVGKLFQPPMKKEPPNRLVQRWLQRHVYARNPGVFIHGVRFTYPVVVWWAWANAACRAGGFAEAQLALKRLASLRPGADPYARALVAMRLGQAARARRALKKAPPDGYLTPYLEGLLAAQDGKLDLARERLGLAQVAADSPERKAAATQALASLPKP